MITAALNTAQATAEHSQQAAQEAAAEMASQTAMVGAAKNRVEHIDEQLHQARVDFQVTDNKCDSEVISIFQIETKFIVKSKKPYLMQE